MDDFETKFIPEPNSGCWLWLGGIQSGKEYGIYGGGNKKAHRVSWTRANGPIPRGMCILHKCDVPLCVNPDHLFVGTQLENIRDRDRKGRQISPRGEAQHSARLTETAVREIRASNESTEVLAARYGVEKTTIIRARSGRTWRHVR